MITTQEEAQKTIRELSFWIQQTVDAQKKSVSTDEQELLDGELDIVWTVRGFCDDLLLAANADGMSGCRLCQS